MTERPDVSPETARLARGLRDLKERAGLSLAGLAAKTTYSKSSWERYLNGKALPPRQAVEELCALTGEPARRLLTLLELSGQFTDTGVGRPRSGAAPPRDVPPRAARPRRTLWVVVAVGVVVAAAGLAFAIRAAHDSPAASAATCHDASCEGRSPGSTLCGTSAATLATDRASGGEEIDIRYSPRCLTAWARLSKSKVGDRIDISAAGGPAHGVRVVDALDAAGYVPTPMVVPGTDHGVRVCLQPAAGARQCFTARVAS